MKIFVPDVGDTAEPNERSQNVLFIVNMDFGFSAEKRKFRRRGRKRVIIVFAYCYAIEYVVRNIR